jgi:hypothetical protein
MGVQMSLTRTEEQHSRLLFNEAQMKALASSLEQKSAHLLQKNELLTEKNTHLEEKNSTYSMEIESLREENESHAREVARIRAERDAATRSHAVVASKLELMHSELALVASSQPVKQPSRKISSPLRQHKQRRRNSNLLGFNTGDRHKTEEDQREGFSFDYTGDAYGDGTASGMGMDGSERNSNDVQSAQQLYTDFMSFSRALQDERYVPLLYSTIYLIWHYRHHSVLEQQELTQQINNLLQAISLFSSHHRELVVASPSPPLLERLSINCYYLDFNL